MTVTKTKANYAVKYAILILKIVITDPGKVLQFLTPHAKISVLKVNMHLTPKRPLVH